MAKFYLAEPDSLEVMSRIQAEGAAGSSLHAQVEVNAAFHRKMREGVMSEAEFQLLCAQFDHDCHAGLWSWFSASPGQHISLWLERHQALNSTFLSHAFFGANFLLLPLLLRASAQL